MRTEEDEAFDDLAKRQGSWGGGFPAKRAMAADKLQEPPSEWAGIKAILDEYGLQAIDFVADFKAALAQPAQERCCYHDSDCAVHNMPAYPAGPCDCTQQFKFWSVTGKYERQAFSCLSGAEAYCKGLNATYPEGNYIVSPLYTTLPQREWVGLTDEEAAWCQSPTVTETWKRIEAKLKEKNNGT